jgi:hypothetical protein
MREEERRLNSRTLTIASVASASAAAVTSQLWIAGTWIAAALTPVLVALISEALHRPTERVARAWTAEREPRSEFRPRAQTATRREPAAVTGSEGPVRIYRQTSRGVTRPERSGPTLAGRRIPWRAVLLTAAAAFAIAIAAITLIDVASSGSVNTTPLGRSSSSNGSQTNGSSEEKQGEQQRQQQEQQGQPSQDQTQTEQQPSEGETTPQTPQSDTAPTPTTPVAPPSNATP